MVLPVPPSSGRIFTLAGSLDFHSELVFFGDRSLAPAASPPCRKQFNVTNAIDMSAFFTHCLERLQELLCIFPGDGINTPKEPWGRNWRLNLSQEPGIDRNTS
jgi:hypothetical protein